MLRGDCGQILAFRAAALHLDRRLPAEDLVEAARPVGLQDTPPGNAAVAAAARVERVTPELWAEALERGRALVGLWAMRGSSYVVAAEDLPVFTAGLLPEDERALLHRLTSTFDEVVEEPGVAASDLVQRLTERARHALAGTTLTKRELGRALAPAIPEPLASSLDPGGTAAEGVRLIPPHDPLLMLRDRDTLVPEELHKRVWRSSTTRAWCSTASRPARRGAHASRDADSPCASSRSSARWARRHARESRRRPSASRRPGA